MCTVGTQTHDDTSTVDAGIQCNLQLNLPERDIIDEEKELEADNSQHEEDNQNDHLYIPSDMESDLSADEYRFVMFFKCCYIVIMQSWIQPFIADLIILLFVHFTGTLTTRTTMIH